jgi:hypothetical protein
MSFKETTTINGTDCDLKEFVAGSSPDALRVHDLIRSLRGEGELERMISIARMQS